MEKINLRENQKESYIDINKLTGYQETSFNINNKIVLKYIKNSSDDKRFYISSDDRHIEKLKFFIGNKELVLNNIIEYYKNIKSNIDDNKIYSDFLNKDNNRLCLYLLCLKLKNRDFFNIVVSESKELKNIWNRGLN